MAIDFPNSPTLNQSFTAGDRTWIWTGSRWESSPYVTVGPTGPAGANGAAGPAGADGTPGRWQVSATAPVSPVSGDGWFDSTRGMAFVYYNDGTSSQWVQVGSANAGPAGVIHKKFCGRRV